MQPLGPSHSQPGAKPPARGTSLSPKLIARTTAVGKPALERRPESHSEDLRKKMQRTEEEFLKDLPEPPEAILKVLNNINVLSPFPQRVLFRYGHALEVLRKQSTPCFQQAIAHLPDQNRWVRTELKDAITLRNLVEDYMDLLKQWIPHFLMDRGQDQVADGKCIAWLLYDVPREGFWEEFDRLQFFLFLDRLDLGTLSWGEESNLVRFICVILRGKGKKEALTASEIRVLTHFFKRPTKEKPLDYLKEIILVENFAQFWEGYHTSFCDAFAAASNPEDYGLLWLLVIKRFPAFKLPSISETLIFNAAYQVKSEGGKLLYLALAVHQGSKLMLLNLLGSYFPAKDNPLSGGEERLKTWLSSLKMHGLEKYVEAYSFLQNRILNSK